MKKMMLGVAVLWLLNCNGESKTNSGNVGKSTPEIGQPTTVSANYSTSMGGFLQNSEMSLSVLPSALPNDTVITATPVKNPAPINDANVIAVSTVYEFGPDGSSFDFAHKPIMTFKFDPNKVIELGGDPNTLSIAWYDANRGVYVGEGGTIDPVTNTIRARVEHFTQYLVISLTQVAANNNHALVGAASFVPATPVAAAPIYVRQTVRDTTNLNPISSVRLYYKIGTAPGTLDKFVVMERDPVIPSTPERYAGQIPADDVTAAGILYEIRATNNFGNVKTSGLVAITIPNKLCPATVNIPSIGVNNNQITVGFSRQFTLSGGSKPIASACTAPFTPVPVIIPEPPSATELLSIASIGKLDSVGSNGYLFTANKTGTKAINFTFGSVMPAGASINQTVIAGSIASLQILDSNLLPIQGTLGITAGTNYQFNLRAFDSFGNEYGAVVATSWDTTGGIGSFPSPLNGVLNMSGAPGATGTVIARIGGYGPPLYIGAVTASIDVQSHSGPYYAYLGGTDGITEGVSTVRTLDGGVIIAGNSTSTQTTIGSVTALNPPSGGNDAIVLKLDASGALQWFTYLGGAGYDYVKAIRQTTIAGLDSGYILAGNSNSALSTMSGLSPNYGYTGGYDNGLIIKLSPTGTIQWWTYLAFQSPTGNLINDIIQASDGGYALVGLVHPGAGGPISSTLTSLHGIPVTGAFAPYLATNESFMAKLSSGGYIQWWRGVANHAGLEDSAYRIVQDTSGDYVIAGLTVGPFNPATVVNGVTETTPIINNFHAPASGSTYDITLTKISGIGDRIRWINYLGGVGNEIPSSLAVTSDGGYLIGGIGDGAISTLTSPIVPHTPSATNNGLILKTDVTGNVLWHTFLGGVNGDNFTGLAITPDGGFVAAGISSSSISSIGTLSPNAGLYYAGGQDALVAKYDAAGVLQWYEFLGGGLADAANSISVAVDGSLLIAGSSYGTDITNFLGSGNLLTPYTGGGNKQMLFVKLRPNGSF